MKIIGSLSVSVILAVLIVFQPIAFSASSVSGDKVSEDELYKEYADNYFTKRDINQAQEISVRESFLKWLYDGVLLEAQTRKRKKALDQTLEILNPSELQGFDEKSYKLPDGKDESSPQISYSAREKSVRDEYNHKYLKARLIKDDLIATANPKQLKKMFNRDLSSTIDKYMFGRYTEAILKFDELIKEYGFNDLDDIFFYRGESYFALGLWNVAIQDYERVVSSDSAETKYHKTALNRLISIYGNMGYQEKLKEHWETFKEAYSENLDDEYWQVVEVVARYMMIAGDLTDAIVLFDQIPKSSEVYINSQQLAAQSAMMQLDLDDAESRFTMLNVSKIGNTRVSASIQNDARLKLGYVSFLRGEYREALNMFNQVEGESRHKEIALISSAWSLYRINVYDQVVTTCDLFVTQFPNSEYKYEALALMGHCREVIGQDTLAIDLFEEIMSAVDHRQDYRDFAYEKRQISKLSSELQIIETEVFAENRRDLFSKYLSVRDQLHSLKENVRLAEGFRANPEIKDMLVEQARLSSLIEGQQDIESMLGSLKHTIKHKRSILKYQNIVTNLDDLNSKLSFDIQYKISRSNGTQLEENRRHEAIFSDSLEQNTNRELQAIDNSLNRVREIQGNIDYSSDPKLLIELTAINDNLQNMRNDLLHIQTGLSNYGEVELTSNLDEWSDYAYIRYTYGGLDFDNFAAQQDRIIELDSYIQKLSQVLADRNRAASDTTKLSEALILASNPGEDPYKAPPVPLWGDIVKAGTENVISASEGEAIIDTSAIEDSIDPAMESTEEQDGEIGDDVESSEPTEDGEPPVFDGEGMQEDESLDPDDLDETEGMEDQSDEDGDGSPEAETGEQKPQEEDADSTTEDEEVIPDSETGEQMPMDDDKESETEDSVESIPADGEVSPDPEEEIQPETSDDQPVDEVPAVNPESPDGDGSEPKQEESGPNEQQQNGDNTSDELNPETKGSDENAGDVPPLEPEEDPSKEDPTQP